MIAGRLTGSGATLMERLGEFRHLAMWVHACRAESVGEVRSTFGGNPSVHYTLDRADMLRFREAMLDVETALCVQVTITMAVDSYREGRVLYWDDKNMKVTPKPPKA